MDEQKQPQDPFNIPFHTHNGADSPQLNPNDFLGFPVITVSDATIEPTDTPISGTIRFLKDSSNYYEWVRFGQEWKGISIGISSAYELISNKATDFSTINNTLYPTVEASDDQMQYYYGLATSYTNSKVPDYSASNDLLIKTTATTVSKTDTTPVKFIEVNCPVSGTLRIKWSIGGTPSFYGYSQIYRNGTAVGTLHNLGNGGVVNTLSEDVSGWSPGDKIQIYGYTDAGLGATVSMVVTSGFADNTIMAVYGVQLVWSYTTF